MRYSRQEKLDFYPADYTKLIQKKKLILIGCGGVGSVLAELLVRVGFLNLVLVDNDIIDETNLSRQSFFERDLGKVKSQALKENLSLINKKVNVKVFLTYLEEKNINKICDRADLIIDATDNFETRKIINFFCEKNNIDWLYTGAVKTASNAFLFKVKEKNFRKVFPENPATQNCCDIGVLPSTTYVTASLALNLILKYFLEISTTYVKLDLWENTFFDLKIKK